MKKNLLLSLLAIISFSIMGGAVSSCTEEQRIEVTDIKIDKNSVDIVRGSTMQLTATITPENATDYLIEWESSNPAVATVTQEGIVEGIAIGNTSVSAKVNGKVSVCRVNVIGKPAESITVTPSEVTIKKEETCTLQAEISPADADQKEITWSTADSSIAVVSQSGEVTAVNVGSVSIYATCGNATDECLVTVEGIAVESISLTPEIADVLVGENIKLSATILPENADYGQIDWSSSDASIATVDGNGTVTGITVGTATITAKIGDVSGSAEITVETPQANVGDFYYSDGTWSTELDESKTVIGIVFYVGQHANDASDYSETGIGKSRCNGYVMALTNALDSYCYWGPEDGSDLGCYPIDENGNIVDNYANFHDSDWSGYKYTQIIIDAAEKNGGLAPEPASAYPAMYYTLAYEDTCPSPASSSGWFLPAISQTWTLVEQRELLARAGAELPVDWYYSSSEDSWALDMVLSINMNTMTCRSNYKESRVNLIRPVLAF